MAPLGTAAGVIFAVTAAAPCSSVFAFAFSPSVYTGCSCKPFISASSSWRSSSSPVTLHQTSDDETSSDNSTTTVDDSAEPSAEPTVDPQIAALKESITSLESDLKAKKYQLSDVQRKADRFSSAGYARQVALGVNNKRTRGANNSDTKSAARAVVMQSFLPVLDELDAVGAKYEGVPFAKTFDSGIRSEFENTLRGLGVTEFVVESGQSIDIGRVVTVKEEYSEDFVTGTIIRGVNPGLEIFGNIVRPAEVVASLGSESEVKSNAAEETEEASAEEGGETSVEEGGEAE